MPTVTFMPALHEVVDGVLARALPDDLSRTRLIGIRHRTVGQGDEAAK